MAMNVVGKVVGTVASLVDPRSAALSGAIDIVVVRRNDGTFVCTPFHVRFGKLQMLRTSEKIVNIAVNGKPLSCHMKLGQAGEAFFVLDTEDEEEIPAELATSPIWPAPFPSAHSDSSRLFSPLSIASAPPPSTSGDPLLSTSPAGQPNMNAPQMIHGHLGAIVEEPPMFTSAVQIDNTGKSPSVPIPIHAGSDPKPRRPIHIDEDNLSETELLGDGDGAVPILAGGSPSSILSGEAPTERPPEEYVWGWGQLPTIAGEGDEKPLEPLPELAEEEPTLPPLQSLDLQPSPEHSDLKPDQVHTATSTASAPAATTAAVTQPSRWRSFFTWGHKSQHATLGSSPSALSETSTTTQHSATQPSLDLPGDVAEAVESSDTVTEMPSVGSLSADAFQKTDDFQKPESVSSSPTVKSGLSQMFSKQPVAPVKPAVSSLLSDPARVTSPTPSVTLSAATPQSIMSAPVNTPTSTPSMGPSGKPPLSRFTSQSSTFSLDSGNRSATHTPQPLVTSQPVPMPAKSDTASNALSPTRAQSSLPRSSYVPVAVPSGPISYSLVVPICEVSQCGHLIDMSAVPTEKTLKIFADYKVTEEGFYRNPNVLYAADAVYKIHDRFYPWTTAVPYVMCMAQYGRAPHPNDMTRMVTQGSMQASSAIGSYSSHGMKVDLRSSSPQVKTAQSPTSPTSPMTSGSSSPLRDNSGQTSLSGSLIPSSVGQPVRSAASTPAQSGLAQALQAANISATSPPPPPLSPNSLPHTVSLPATSAELPKKKGWRSWLTFGRTDSKESGEKPMPPPTTSSIPPVLPRQGRKSLKPTSDQIAQWGLKPGMNTIVFSATSRIQGTQEVHSSIYLWKEDTKIVISDIDGTITRSDVLGQFLPIWGKDWSQVGVAELLTNVKKHGYEVLYLTARAIGQARITRDYIQGLKQGKNSLPLGPVVTTPDSLFAAFHREVIRRRPDEFKIACLMDIRHLFPATWNPFYAGFGNRETDALSYRAVGVPLGKIFLISPTGELKCFVTTYRGYNNINELVHELFPVIRDTGFVDEKFNEWNFWKTPLPDNIVYDFDEPSPKKSGLR